MAEISRGARKISELDEALDFNNIPVDDGTPIGKRMTKASLKALLTIEGTEMEPLVGGTTSGTALVVPNGPSGEQRTAEVSSGKYYDFGSGPQLADANKRWKAYWSGSSWSLKDMGALPQVQTVPVAKKDGSEAWSLGGAYTALNGGDYILDQKILTGYITTPTNALRTYIFDYMIPYSGYLGKINYYATVAGDVYLRVYKRVGNNVTFKSTTKVTLLAGNNVLDLTALKIPVESGDVPGFAYDPTVALGRIGFNASAPEANYYTIEGSGTGTFALPTKAVGGGFGLYFTFTGNKGVLPNIDALIKKTTISGLVPAWTPQTIGSNPNPTISQADGYNQVTFTTNNNQAVYSVGALANGKKAWVKFKAKLISGASPAKLVVGEFATIIAPPKSNLIEVTTTEKEYFLELLGIANNSISIGMRQVDNAGQVIAFKDFYITEDENNLEVVSEKQKQASSIAVANMPDSFNCEAPLSTMSKYDKKLLKGGGIGNSLSANPLGGVIPNAEAVTRRPIRLGFSNTLSRRFYDYMSWNKPTWLRLDDTAWVKTGSWTTLNNTSFFEPIYSNELYHTTGAGSTASVNVPSGNENFAFVVRKGTNSGVLEIYLNDTLIQTVDTLKAGAGHTGNPYFVIEVLDMPIGQVNNVKVVSKGTNTNPVYVWGGFYWTGTTMIMMNVAHADHSLKQLLDEKHIDDEVVDNNFDFLLFELPIMNDAADITLLGYTLEASAVQLRTILDTKIKGKDTLFFSCQPYGLNPNDLSQNFMTMYPQFIPMKDTLKKVLFDNKKSYRGVTETFVQKIINKGGTIATGEGGLYYTWDGMHQNEAGMLEFWNILKAVLANNPVKIG